MAVTNRKKVLRLVRRNGLHCCYCKRLTVMSKSGEDGRGDEVTTLEHVYSKNDLRRYAAGGGGRQKIACRKCNNDRNSEETERMELAYIELGFWQRVSLVSFFNGNVFVNL